MNPTTVNRLLEVGIALSKEKNGDRLLELILTTAMDITVCDAGTLYILNGDQLDFKLMITKSMGILKGGRYGPIDLPPVPLSLSSACARAALERTMFNVPDGYKCEDLEFDGPRQYDAITGYHTISMLVVPMEDDKGRIIGVLQLLNAMDANGEAIPFHRDFEPVIRSLASQAAICMTNMNYALSVQEFMDSFVRVMSAAIDARTPYNANHTRGMVRMAAQFMDWLDKADRDWSFDEQKKQLFLMSVWLHDVGKLTIPLEIMDKESRVGAHLEAILYRFQVIALTNQISLLRGEIDEAAFHRCRQAIDEAKSLICRINRIYIPTQDMLCAVRALGEKTYADEAGNTQPWLTSDEVANLCIPRGTLTPEERTVMESHVSMTIRMLDEMKFPPEYADVPNWASCHHEFLDGSGYPRGLAAKDIPQEARLLTILDIFDALTQDRPYSPAQPVESALLALGDMVRDGKLDGHILALFQESRAWEECI